MTLSVRALSESEVIISGDEKLQTWWDAHVLPVPGREHSPYFRSGRWDGLRRPGDWCRQNGDQFELKVSRGMLPRVVTDLGGSVQFNVTTLEEVAAFAEKYPQYAKLRDYQQRAIMRVLMEGWGRVAYATNAGKGAVIGLLARFAMDQKKQVVILCDEISVYDALVNEIRTWGGIEPGLVKAGVKAIPVGHLVVLAMVQTLQRRVHDSKEWQKWLGKTSMLLLDEADKADADTWKYLLRHAKHTVWRAGFSGSFPDDDFGSLVMDGLMGPLLERVKNDEMVERKISARPLIEIHAFDQTQYLDPWPDEWWDMDAATKRRWVYERAIIYNEARHQFLLSLLRPDTQTVIIVTRIDHGEQLALWIPDSVFLSGGDSESQRLEELDKFARGTLKVLIVTKILDRGTNRLGHAADLIFASSEGSTRQVLQRIGRGLRRGGGKEFLRLVDVVDRVQYQTQPQKDKKRYQIAAAFLHGAAHKRLEVYANEGFDVELKRTTT